MQDIVSIKKTLYTIWANRHLQAVQIRDLYFDISNGSLLLHLIESLWNEPIDAQWNKNPQNYQDKRKNMQIALDYLTQKKGLNLKSISSSNLVNDKSGKEALPLLDAIYSCHSIDSITFGEEKGKKALLNWCKSATDDSQIKMNDFTTSWRDGKAISAIISKYKPSGMNLEQINDALGIKQMSLNVCDESINLILASQLFQIFANPSQILTAQPVQEQKKEVPQKASTNQPVPPVKNTNQISLNTYNKNENKKPSSGEEPSKNIFKRLFGRNKSEKKINLKIKTPEFIPPNFVTGRIPENVLKEILKQDDLLPRFINNRFQKVVPSRYPVQVAVIPKGSKKVDFKKNELKTVLERAGSRPIICVSILGSYQQGKSTTLSGITGNYGYAIGNSMNDKTKGVYIDGPYEIDYLYERFNYIPSKENFYLKVDALKPVVFLFDIEGYGGVLHGEEEKKNTDLFIQLCTPFMCISSVFIYLSPAAPQVHEIQTIVDTMRISTLTSVPKDLKEETNGELKMIIPIKSFKILPSREDPYTKDEIEEKINDQLMRQLKDSIKKTWQGKNTLEKSGIHAVFAPLMDKESIRGYTKTFGYLAKDVISGIEVASQGHFMRGYQNTLNLYDFIVSHYHDGKFSDKIKERISEEYKNTLGRMALRTLYVVRDEISVKLDEEYNQMEKNLTQKRISLHDIKNKYFEIGQVSMEKKLDVVGDTTEVHRYYQLLCYFISEMIDKKENHYRELCNNEQARKSAESNEITMEFYTKNLESTKSGLLQTLKSNNYFNFDKDATNNFVVKETSSFGSNLRSLKIQKNLFINEDDIIKLSENFKNELMNEIMIEFNNDEHLKLIEDQKEQARIKDENIKKQKDLEEKARLEKEEKLRKEKEIIENNKREAEIQRQKEEARIFTENGRAKIIIDDKMDLQLVQAFTMCERTVITDLKDSLEDKQQYLNTYKDIDNIIDQIKEKIKEELYKNVDEIVLNGINELSEKKGGLFDAIMRVYQNEKNTFITEESINRFVENRNYTISDDIKSAYNTARVLLTTYAYEQKKERTNEKKWFAIKFRKITIYPDGTEVPGEWQLARKVKRGWWARLLETFKIKDYTYAHRIDQYHYGQLVKLLDNQ
ncbi:alpha-actinin [Tritrichomonas musculus]|uniref:Alpha-actinin n=1 Tax=Tritrichomonas musculus TaxID=1915356 RepID=A0ABR2H5F4_9EUKA